MVVKTTLPSVKDGLVRYDDMMQTFHTIVTQDWTHSARFHLVMRACIMSLAAFLLYFKAQHEGILTCFNSVSFNL